LVAETQNHLIEGRHKTLSTSRAKIEIDRTTTQFPLQIRQKSRKLALFPCRVCGTRFICSARNAHADLKKMLDSSLRNAKHSPQRNATSTISGTRVANQTSQTTPAEPKLSRNLTSTSQYIQSTVYLTPPSSHSESPPTNHLHTSPSDPPHPHNTAASAIMRHMFRKHFSSCR
jgi:hypothetical protein